MPPTKAAYLPDDKTMSDQADTERRERAAWIDTAFDYYEGQHKRPLKSEKDGTNSSVILNHTGSGIDDLIQFLGVPALEIPGAIQREPGADGALAVTKSDPQQQLEAFWAALPEFLADLALWGFVAGHVFVRLYIDDAEQIRAERLDTRLVTVFWDAGRLSRPLWYRVSWQYDDKTNRRLDIVPNRLLDPTLVLEGSDPDGWQIIEYQSNLNSGRWDVVARDAWDFPFAPIVEWKNRQRPRDYYGMSDVRKQLNDAINFAASNTAKIIKHHGGPQTIITGGAVPDDVETGPGTFLEIAEPEAKVYNLEMQSDLASSLAFLEKLEARLFSEMHVVDMATIKDKLGQITNFGVRMLFIKMIKLLETRRRGYGKGLRAISLRVLWMMDLAVDEVVDVWPDVLPVNRTELVTTLDKERVMGVLSVQTASEDLGRDFDVEQEQIDEERKTQDDRDVETNRKLGDQGIFK